MKNKYDGFEFTCTNKETYRCVSYNRNSKLYHVYDSHNVQVDTLVESVLEDVLKGLKPLSYEMVNRVETMVVQDDKGSVEEYV
jgi:hypothetical protein